MGKKVNIIFTRAGSFGIPNDDQITKNTGNIFRFVKLSRQPRSVDTTGFPRKSNSDMGARDSTAGEYAVTEGALISDD